MADGARIAVDLVIIAARLRLVAEKVDFLELVVGFDVPQAIGLIPAVRKDIEADLATDGVREIHIGEFLLKIADHLLAHLVLDVVGGEHIPLLPRALTSNGADVHHAVPELDEGTPLDGQFQLGKVAQHKVEKPLQRLLPKMLDDVLLSHLLAAFNLDESILREYEVELVEDLLAVQLLEHLLQIGTTHNSNGCPGLHLCVEELLELGRHH